jgi:hypothetical protein
MSERDERRDRGVKAMRADGDYREAGPSLAATKEGRLLDNGPERTGGGRSDADESKLDQILAHLDSIHNELADTNERMDGFEAKYGRKDADEDSEGAIAGAVGAEPGKPKGLVADRYEREERDDADQGTSERAPLLSRHDSSVRPIESSQRISALAAAFQARADRAMQSLSIADAAPRHMQGETLIGYQQRILSPLKKYSSAWKGANIYSIRDPGTLEIAATQIFDSVMEYASSPASVPEGTLRPVTETDQSGRKITRWYGSPEACWGRFKQQPRRMVGINLKPQG